MALNHHSVGETDVAETLHDLLTDLSLPPSAASEPPTPHPPSWRWPRGLASSLSLPPSEPATSSPTPFPDLSDNANATENSGTQSLHHHLRSRTHSPGVPDIQSAVVLPPTSSTQPTHFHTPPRSIFSSAPPTSSISANTARASLSALPSSSSSRPLAALTMSSPLSSRRPSTLYEVAGSSVPKTVSSAEKDVDDVTRPFDNQLRDRLPTNPPTAVSRLFAASDTVPPTVAKPASYIRSGGSYSYTRASTEVASLPTHLYSRGLLSGKHSDITVHAFNTSYALHRIILDRSPFFSSAFSGPWAESSAKDMSLHPEELDSNITQAAFELALKRLYGCNMVTEEDKEAVGLFATGFWLEMSDLVDASVDSLLRQMHPSKLASMIHLVTSNYYGKPGDRILASAKTMLYREGWEMPYMYWDSIPSEIIREIIGGDAFFVPSEWERWYLAVKLLNRRLKAKAIATGLIDASGKFLQDAPSINFFALRFDAVYRRTSTVRNIAKKDTPWITLYTSSDVEPLLVLLDEGIHYMHLSFEQLQYIRSQCDIFGTPVLPDKVISDALWMQMELRQKVINAKDCELELGLSYVADSAATEDNDTDEAKKSDDYRSEKSKEKDEDTEQEDEVDESGGWDGNGKPRKFWIPSTDSTSIMGGTADAFVAAANGSMAHATRHYCRLTNPLEPQDAQWTTDLGLSSVDRPHNHTRSVNECTPPITYSHYPPFRFAAEFPSPKNLKERKRVYSRTVWYAGSLWNVYIQRVNTPRNSQLGVYLHRAKDERPSDEISGVAGGPSVDDRIGSLEREMLMRSRERRARRNRVGSRTDDEDEGSGSGDPDATLVPPANASAVASGLSGFLRSDGATKSAQIATAYASPAERALAIAAGEEEDEEEEMNKLHNHFRVSTVPLYVDARPTIKTYFKIYTPSKAGRMLSVYESAPDIFNFSQSWGWKSSTMILDDGILGYDQPSKGSAGRLRLTVVIGNV